ncbi:MAG: cupin domain-containing protein [Desulfobulbaceae bacterium]|nr:cupin domain-containing protein [Desulfobulbaceae bacterium]
MPGKDMKIGERIRSLRKAKGLSLEQLSEQSGIAEETLYGIEGNLISPPLGNIVSLAKLFEISVGEFFGEGGDAPYCIVRSDDRKTISRFNSTDGSSAGYSYASLGYKKKNRNMEPFLVTLTPSEAKDIEPNQHIGEEILFVLEGEVEVRLMDQTEILCPGDSIYYDSTMPHVVLCHGQEPATILAVIYAKEEMIIL